MRAVPAAAALIIGVAASAQVARDVLSIGNAAARPGTVAHLPVYVRDVSGTTLGVDTGDNGGRIQAFRWTAVFANPALVEGCKPQQQTPSAHCQVTFTPGGVLAKLKPATEIIVAGTNSISVRYTYDRQSQRIPFTSNQTTPGDLIGTIDVLISNDASLGGAIAFTFNQTADEPSLSDNLFGGTITEGVGGELEVSGGAIHVADTDCLVAPTPASIAIDSLGACTGLSASCTVPATIAFQASGDYTYRSCDTVTWSFGDGATATGRNVTHTYNSAGTYPVRLTVANPAGSASVEQIFRFSAAASCIRCSADVPLSATLGQVVTFSAKLDCPGGAVRWQFGDGPSVVVGENVTKAYYLPGFYNWVMTATQQGIPCTAQGTIQVVAGVGQSPCCAADVPQSGVVGRPVTFRATPLQTCSPGDYVWDFGDGPTERTSMPMTVHVYAETRSYNWVLLISSGVSCTTGGTIAIEPPPPPKQRASRP